MGNRRVRQDAVAEIEDERPRRERLEDGIDRTIQRRASDQQRKRIEITLDWPSGLNTIAGELKIDRPVQTHRIDRDRLEIRFETGAGPAWKTDNFRFRDLLSHCGDNPGRRLDTPSPIFPGRQNTGPAVKNLDRIHPGCKLPRPDSSPRPRPERQSAAQTRRGTRTQTAAPEPDRAFRVRRSCKSRASRAHRKIPAAPCPPKGPA